MFLNWIKRLRLSYNIYNFFHKKLLVHNLPAYHRLGLRKKYYSTISSKDLQHLPQPNPTSISSADLKESLAYTSANHTSQQRMLDYPQNGYMVIQEFLNHQQVDEINREIENIIKYTSIRPSYGRYMQLVKHSTTIQHIAKSENLLQLCEILLGGSVHFFQSINFLKGSEQQTHSDSFHMTTYPQGGLLGIWIALEDVGTEQGALHYYPGSHTLPYLMNDSFGNEGNWWMLGKHNYPPYANMVQQQIKEHGLEKKIFYPKKGDLFIWHANLLHGGEKQTDPNLTRKSLVLHYLKKDSICYHEISQRPALIESL